MKKLFRRFIAYTIDMMVVLLIVQCIAGIPQINRQLDKYNKYFNDYIDMYEDWLEFKADLKSDFEDENLTTEEYDELVKEHEHYTDVLDEYYSDGEFTKSDYDDLNNRIDKDYEKDRINIYYKMEKSYTFQLVIYLVVVIAYFVLFNMITKGQTLGKKLTRLKIVNAKADKTDVSVLSYIIRAIILYQTIYYLVRLVGINFLDAKEYYDIVNVVYGLQGYLEMIIIAMVMIRIDGRGLHDLLSGTRVVLYDKNGNEVKDKLDLLVKERKNIINSNKNKAKRVIDEESTNE